MMDLQHGQAFLRTVKVAASTGNQAYSSPPVTRDTSLFTTYLCACPLTDQHGYVMLIIVKTQLLITNCWQRLTCVVYTDVCI